MRSKVEHHREKCELDRRAERSFKRACSQALAKEMTHDLDVNFNGNREGTAEHATKTQDTRVGAVENAEECAVR